MVTGMDSMVAHQRRGEVAREVDAGRGRRRVSWFQWRIGPPAAAPKIRHLGDAGVPART
ncbi:MAG TPA: hypothetical protein VGV91_10325 [Rubrobacter sp.]|nr:hypothetical protein [Rubrobacter sp.]